MLDRAHRVALVTFAALVGLVEGPAEVAAVLVLVTMLATGGFRGFRPGIAEVGILVWALAGVPGTLLDAGVHSSGDTTRPLIALCFVIGARGIGRADPKLLSQMAWAFGIACVLNGAYGLIQFLLNRELPLESLFLKTPRSAQIWIPNRVYHVRASAGLFYNRLKLAHVGMVGAFLIVMVALAPDVRRRVRLLAGAGGLLLGGGLLFTYARMAFVAVAASAVALAAVLRRWIVLGSVAAMSVVAAGGVLLTENGRRRMSSLVLDFGIRQTMFETALAIFWEHPILGVGHGVYRSAMQARAVDSLSGVHLTSPHNLWLQVLAETGIVGFVGFNLAVGYCLYRVIRRIRAGRANPIHRRLDRLALLGVVAISFVGLMHFSLHHAPVGLVFWTLAGVCVRTESDGEEASQA